LYREFVDDLIEDLSSKIGKLSQLLILDLAILGNGFDEIDDLIKL
jgi:hypothetical protein